MTLPMCYRTNHAGKSGWESGEQVLLQCTGLVEDSKLVKKRLQDITGCG